MNDKMLEALTRLADKLGTTAAHLWDVLIRQAKIEVAVDLGFVVLAAFACYLLRKWWISYQDRNGEGELITLIIATTACAIMSAFALFNLCEIPTLLFNPQFWALSQILDALK